MLSAGRKRAQFYPLVESSTTAVKTTIFECSATSVDNFEQQVQAAINPSLGSSDREQIDNLLLDFSDVFEDSLGHTTLVTYKIDTGDSAPIKQRVRRLPFAHAQGRRRATDKRNIRTGCYSAQHQSVVQPDYSR